MIAVAFLLGLLIFPVWIPLWNRKAPPNWRRVAGRFGRWGGALGVVMATIFAHAGGAPALLFFAFVIGGFIPIAVVAVLGTNRPGRNNS